MRLSARPAVKAALRNAREAAGLSQRDLASRMGVSWVTVREAENGRDLRRSTLEAFLGALPTLCPDDLLSAPAAGGALASHDEAWQFYRDLFGFEAGAVAKVLTIAPSGDCDSVTETRGLRSLAGDMRDLSILVGLQRAVFQGSASVLRSIEASRDSFTTRVVERREAHAVHQFRFPRRLARGGITYRRHAVTRGLYLLTSQRAAVRFSSAGPFYEGTTSPVGHPARSLRIVVRFPGSYWPEELRPVAWPTVQVPDADLPDLSDRLQPEGLALRLDRGAGTATLRVERPLVGLKYGIGWRLP